MTDPGPRRARRGRPHAAAAPAVVSEAAARSAHELPRQESRRGSGAAPAATGGRRNRWSGPPGPRPSSPLGWARWLLLPAGGLLLAGWAACCLVDAGGFGGAATAVAALAALAPFEVVVAVPLVTVAVRHRRWLSAGLAAVAALLPWWFALGYAAPSDTPVQAGAGVVHLMVVDAQQGRASARDVVAAAAAGHADLLVVTELSGTLAHDLTAAGLDRLMQARSVQLPGQQQVPDVPEAGLGVWSRIPVDAVQPVLGTQWPAVTARVSADGAALTLVTGHATPPVPDGGLRWAQDLAALRDRAAAAVAAGGPVVLLGNLNATPWHADFRRFAAVGLEDAADRLGQGLRPTWPAWSPFPVLPLDHALVGGAVGVDAIDTMIIGGTDHRALLVTLRIPRG